MTCDTKENILYLIHEQRRSAISRTPFGILLKHLEGGIAMQQLELLKHTDKINELLARYGVKFGIYKNNIFKEQLFPFDSIQRIIEHK